MQQISRCSAVFSTFFIGSIGLGFLIVGTVFIVGGLPRSQVITCHRVEPGLINCQNKRAIAGFVTHESRLERLQRVRVSAVAADDQGGSAYHQVNLLGMQTSVALEYLSEDDANTLANKVNRLITSSTNEPLTIQSSYRSWKHILVGLIVVAIVLFFAASAVNTRKSRQGEKVLR